MYLFPASEFEAQAVGGDSVAGAIQRRDEFVIASMPCAPVGRAVSKRIFDFLVAVGLLAFLAPLLVLTAILVRATSPGPALFKQRRTGLNGKVFHIYKFRTMTVMEDGHLLPAQREDARVTRLGAILRRSSLDELPQLLNIIKGEMSLVGPRPHAIAHDELYSTLLPNYVERFRARPGLTGLAQVTGFRGEVKTIDCLKGRVEADVRYIGEWSMLMDVIVLFSTALLIWRDERAY
jgi:putative colanic acid biosynthesis UDP-glucose lipid carrier transferase